MALDPNINTRESQKFRDGGTGLTRVGVEIENFADSPGATEQTLSDFKAEAHADSQDEQALLTNINQNVIDSSALAHQDSVDEQADINEVNASVQQFQGEAHQDSLDEQTILQEIVDAVDDGLAPLATETTLDAFKTANHSDLVAVQTKQDTGNASLASIDGKLNSLGQKTSANSVPVTIASDQSAIPASQSGAWTTGRTWSLSSSTDSAIVFNKATISPVNSTTTPLGSNATFTGTFEATSGYVTIGILINTDSVAASSALHVDFSTDGTNLDKTIAIDIATGGEFVQLASEAAFYRIRITAGSIAQTYLRAQTTLHTMPIGSKYTPLIDVVEDSSSALLTRSVIIGKTTAGGGTYVSVKVNPSGAISADVSGSTVSVTSSALPTGAATAANQTSEITQLTAINANTDAIETRIGDLTETAPANDTASSGLNGRLQRIAQNITTFITQSSARYNVVDTGNSTMANLAGGAIFLGTFADVLNWSNITIGAISDKISATNGLQIEWSADGVTVHDTDSYTLMPNSGQQYTFGAKWRYFRVRYTNGGATTTAIAIQTRLHANTPIASTHRLLDVFDGQQDGQMVVTSPARVSLSASSPTSFSVGVASSQAVASNSARKGLSITNNSTATMHIGIGATAVVGSGLVLYPGGTWTMDDNDFSIGAINMIATAAASSASIQEFTLP